MIQSSSSSSSESIEYDFGPNQTVPKEKSRLAEKISAKMDMIKEPKKIQKSKVEPVAQLAPSKKERKQTALEKRTKQVQARKAQEKADSE